MAFFSLIDLVFHI